MTQASHLIKLENITVCFKQRTVLDDVSFAIHPNEIITLVGPNGAGKTTLVRLLLRLQQPTRGTIHYNQALKIGYMPQKIHFDPSLPLTVTRFLCLTESHAPETISEWLSSMGILHLASQEMCQLSGGETQRVLLAKALLNQPNLLVLDEPAQGMDVTAQLDFYQRIADIRQTLNCAIVLISHDLHLVMAQTDTVICLNHHVCCHGHPETVSKDPNFVKLFGDYQNILTFYNHHHNHKHP